MVEKFLSDLFHICVQSVALGFFIFGLMWVAQAAIDCQKKIDKHVIAKDASLATMLLALAIAIKTLFLL